MTDLPEYNATDEVLKKKVTPESLDNELAALGLDATDLMNSYRGMAVRPLRDNPLDKFVDAVFEESVDRFIPNVGVQFIPTLMTDHSHRVDGGVNDPTGVGHKIELDHVEILEQVEDSNCDVA